MAIELEKILTISAEAYVGRHISVRDDYDLVGVSAFGAIDEHDITDGELCNPSPKELFSEEVPDEAEIVTDYKIVMVYSKDVGQHVFEANGTALVPKKKVSKDNINELEGEN